MRVLVCLLFFTFFQVNATHIVGGYISYKHVGGTTYDITFKIYRDCSSQVGFDGENSSNPNSQLPEFRFSIVADNSANGFATESFTAPFNPSSKITVSSVIVNPCLIKDGTCVEEATYTRRITLPSSTMGYTIVHQRCCRNGSILNIQNQDAPNQTDKPGITLKCYIPPTTPFQNNSATFKEIPPLFICKDISFYYDHSAVDIDGDSLDYALVTPLAGLSSSSPSTNDPSLFGVTPVDWNSPYSLTNVIGGAPTMTIDPKTGLMNCKPIALGRFVVSVQCREFRNGVVINTFFRDFQFNVTNCNIPSANMPLTNRDPNKKIGDYKINCSNYSVKFTNLSDGADYVLWRFGDPGSGINDTSSKLEPTHNFSDTGKFIVTLYAFKRLNTGQLCIDSLRGIVGIYPLFKPDFTIDNACEESPIKLTDKTTSTFGKIIFWDWVANGTTIASNKISLYSNLPAGSHNILLRVRDDKGCYDSILKQAIVYSKPKINYTIPNPCQFETVQLLCKSTVASPYTIISNTWVLPNGTRIDSCNTTTSFNTSGINNLKLIATTDKGCIDSANVPITIFPKPVVSSTPNTKICYDKTIQLNAIGAVNYEWSPNQFLDNHKISNPICSPAYPNSVSYIVKGTDANGCSDTASTTISFFTKPFISAGLDTSVCLNPSPFKFRDSVILNGQGTFNSVSWSPSAGLDNPNILTPKSKPKQTTTYILTGIDNNNCAIKDTVEVLILDPSIDLISKKDTAFCVGDTIQVNPYDQGDITSYKWTVLLNGSEVPAYWVSNANIRNPRFSALDTTTYILEIENYCYKKKDTIALNAIALPDGGLPDFDTICLFDIYQFNATNGMSSYLWSTVDKTISSKIIRNPSAKPSVTSDYKLFLVDKYGCKGTDSTKIIVNYPPALSVAGQKAYICQGDSLLLWALSSSNVIFKWSPNSFITNTDSAKIFVFPPKSTSYVISATNAANCITRDTIPVVVQEPVKAVAKSPYQMCFGKYIEIEASGGKYYLWKPSYNINDTAIAKPQVYPDTSITYSVRVSNDCFSDSTKVFVRVDTIPVVTASNDTTIYRSAEVVLTAISKANKFEWTPKTGTSNPFFNELTVTPYDTTMYYVSVTDDNGCIGTDSVRVNVYGKTVMLIPTAFSPNGDGTNDIFKIVKHLNIRKLNAFDVYDRWGNLVFSSTDINKGWDGTVNGEPVNEGVYVWKVQAVTYDKETINKSGNITLLR
jgi:gliding motility-associated-like protein